MLKPLAPIVARANATNRMRELREAIEFLKASEPNVTPANKYRHLAKIQTLERELNRLKTEFIHVVVVSE